MSRRWRSAIVLVCGLSMLAGCGRAPGPGGDGSERKLRIAMIPKGTSHDFWYSVHAGARRADAELPDVEITWKGPLSEGDTSDQIEIVENFIAEGYDGICLAPLDAVALRKPVEQAIENGIPVVIFDSGLKNHEGIVSYVATNNHRGGRRAGEHLAKLLGGKGKVILMRYEIGSESTEQREQGFLEVMADHPDIELISADRHAGPDESGAVTLGEDLMANFGDQVEGIFCPNQSTASGMLIVLRRDPRGLAGKTKFVGFDSGANIADGLTKGDMHATVLQDPVRMGYEAVRVMVDHLQGRPVEKRVEIPESLATTDNVDDLEIRALLYPDVVE